MRDVFISHADEDAPIALALARGLQAVGFTTWCYEDDSDPGPSYLSQIDEELENTQAVVLIVSASSLASRQVLKEVVRAHEAGKPFIPLRRGVAHEAVHQQRDWRMALGASVSIAMPDEGVEAILPRVIRGLERSGVHPSATPPGSGRPDPASVATGGRHAPAVIPPGPPVIKALGDRLSRTVGQVSHSTRIGITAVVGVLGVIASFANVAGVMNPTGASAALYRIVPAIGTANLVTNVAGLGLNAALLFSLWQLYNGRTGVSPRIRLITSLMLIAICVWLVVVVFAALFPPYGRLRGGDRFSVIVASLMAAVVAGLPAALVRSLFRR